MTDRDPQPVILVAVGWRASIKQRGCDRRIVAARAGRIVAVRARLVPGRRALVLGRQGAGQLAQRLLVLLVGDLREVASQLEAHALTRTDWPAVIGVETVEDVADRHAQHPG